MPVNAKKFINVQLNLVNVVVSHQGAELSVHIIEVVNSGFSWTMELSVRRGSTVFIYNY